ncbi:MAG TPA: type I phosphomannose isomerase catalytic subunit [Planctomycetota bacterium]|nr:type I phosphomannose isomerase catalytic subunit [Planctomycetota bacterium]
MPPPRPLLLERKLLPKVWGGRALEHVLGLRLPLGEAIGETWELFDRPEGSSRVRDNSTTLAQVLQEDPAAWLGSGVSTGYGGRFPLLVKFLDTKEALSVQVHPDDEQAQVEGDGGKNEVWVVLHAGKNARIIRGLRPGVDLARFRAGAHTAAVEPMLFSFTPRVGDTVHVPPGTVHSIGPNVVVFELQQNSDVTYRLYDWGRSREVQVEKALAVMRPDEGSGAVDRPVVPPQTLPDGGKLLITTKHFRLRRYELARPYTLATDRQFATVTVVGGRGILGWHSGGVDTPMQLMLGDTVLIPACVSEVFVSPIGRLEVLVASPGGA